MTTLAELFGAALIVPDVVTTPVAAGLRARLEPRFTRHALVDRGSYDVARDLDEPDVLATLARVAERVTGRTLMLAEARAVRLFAGDYIFAHHDRLHDDNPVEVVLDVSAAPVAGAEVHYRRRGQVFFRVPCAPGAAAVVERGPTVTCNHAYLSKLQPDACVVRIVALLR